MTNLSLEVNRVVLDFSKALYKVWHVYFLYKLGRMGICGKYLGLIDSFLCEKFQRVLLNGTSSRALMILSLYQLFNQRD